MYEVGDAQGFRIQGLGACNRVARGGLGWGVRRGRVVGAGCCDCQRGGAGLTGGRVPA